MVAPDTLSNCRVKPSRSPTPRYRFCSVKTGWLSWKSEGFYFAGTQPATTLLFETSVALTVVGSVGLILDTIAVPLPMCTRWVTGRSRVYGLEVWSLPNKKASIHPFEDTF
jgi:hypothetical protein